MERAAAVPSLALVVALGAAGCVRGVGTQEEPDVAKLELRGVTAFDPGQIEAGLATQNPVRRPGIVEALVKDRQKLDPDALSVDRRRIEAFYRERGYYSARVTDVEVRPAGRGLVDVVITISEGSPVRVSKIDLEGLDVAPEAGAAAGELPLRVGGVFTVAAYDATRGALLSALHDTGWALAEVSSGAEVDPAALSAEVTYTVKPGERFRFGGIVVAGAGSISKARIVDQAAGAIRVGEWWNESKLAEAQARVFQLGVFGGVRVTRGPPDAAHRVIPVIVYAPEAPFRTLRAGPGIGVQANRYDAHLLFGWTNRNFLGDLRRVGTDARVGYAWIPTLFAPTRQGPVALVAGELQQPGALTRWVDTSVRLEVERGIEEAYDFWSQRLKLGLPLRISSRWTLVPSYNLEVYELSNFAADFVPVTTVPGTTPGTPQLENCRGSVCLLTFLEQRIGWDGRDDPVATRRGIYAAVSVQEGFVVGSYGYRYLRFLPELRGFLPVRPGVVLATRARVGALVPIAETGLPPLVARFTAGGPNSMRGYYTRRLAPMVLSGGTWVPVGGNGLADGSVELRFDIVSQLGGAVFVDAGGVSDAKNVPSEWQKALDPTQLQWAVGLGLRYRTPFGPLRFDLGVRLPTRYSGPVASRFPAVPYTRLPDGTEVMHREPIAAVHISLGEAF